MSKLADARGLNMCLAWREHICLCDRIVIKVYQGIMLSYN